MFVSDFADMYAGKFPMVSMGAPMCVCQRSKLRHRGAQKQYP